MQPKIDIKLIKDFQKLLVLQSVLQLMKLFGIILSQIIVNTSKFIKELLQSIQ